MTKFIFHHKLSLYVAALVLTFAVSSCDPSDFGDLNENPNSTTVPVTSALLTNAIKDMGTLYGAGSALNAGLYAQYISETQYTEASLYALSQPSWNGTFYGALYDLQNIIDVNTNPETAADAIINGSNNNQIAVARILKAFFYSLLTDRYGDMPYSQALTRNTQPIYDSQEAIYKDLFKELDEAVAQFDEGIPAQGDILFGGDIEKWKQFANSWRLILAMRISDADAATGKTQFNDALNSDGGVIESNADNVALNYPGGNFRNPWFDLYNGRKDYAISNTIVETLKNLKDARLTAYGQANSKNDVVPVPYGLTRDEAVAYTNANPDWAFVLDAEFRKQNSTLFILTAAHVYLARAEAAQIGWTTENATTMYQEGIKASWEQWDVFSQEAYDAYLAASNVSLAAGDALQKIQLQRWLAFYPDGIQGWSEWRRTGVPALTPTPNAVNSSKQIPRRFVYPNTEPNLNTAAYNEAVKRIGADTPDTKLWWDK